MKIDTHIENLQKKHDDLDKMLHEKSVHHAHHEEICDLKRQKLLIKDQIELLVKKIDEALL